MRYAETAVSRASAAAPSAPPHRFLAAAALCAALLIPARASAQTRFYSVDGATLTLTGDSSNGGAIPVPDGGAGTYYVWFDNSNAVAGSTSVYITHLSSTGALAAGWPTANSGKVQVTNNASDQNGKPGAGPDGAGGVVVTYQGAAGALSAFYATRINSAGTAVWADKALTPGNATKTLGITPLYPVGNNLMFVHESVPSGAAGGYVGALDLGTGAQAFAANGGYGVLIATIPSVGTGGSSSPQRLFSANGNLLTTSGPQSNSKQFVVPDAAGGFYEVWTDTSGQASGSAASVYVLRISSTGAAASGWNSGAGAVRVTNNFTLNNGDVNALADGLGGVDITWIDATSGNGLLQRYNPSGVAQLTAGGVTIYSLGGGFGSPIYVDSTHALFGQLVPGTPNSLNVQTFNPTTGALGAGNGVAISTLSAAATNRFSFAPTFSPAGGGQANPGMIFSISADFRGVGYNDVYAWRVDSALAVNWAQQVSVAAGDKGFKDKSTVNNGQALAIDVDGAGGAYIAWVSSQTGVGSQIYAADLTAAGAFAAGYQSSGTLIATGLSQAGQLAIAGGASQGYVVAWTDNLNPGTGANPVFAQVVGPSAALKLGSGGRAIGTGQTQGTERGPSSAAALSTGTAAVQYVVSWSSNTGSSTANPPVLQAFDVNGNVLLGSGGFAAIQNAASRYANQSTLVAIGNNLAVSWQEANNCVPGPCQNYDYVQFVSTYAPPTGSALVNPQIGVAPSYTGTNPGLIAAVASLFDLSSTNIALEAVKVDVSGAAAFDWQKNISVSIGSTNDQPFGQSGGTTVLVADADGAGGAYIGWISSATSPGGEIYVTELSGASGAAANGFAASGTRVAYANRAGDLSIVGGGTHGVAVSWDNQIGGGTGAPRNPIYFQMASTAAVTQFAVGTNSANPGGTVVGVGQAFTANSGAGGGIAVTTPSLPSPTYFVAWSSNTGSGATPLLVQAFDVGGNKLFGNGYTAIQDIGSRFANNAQIAGMGVNNVAIGWGEGQGCGGGPCTGEYDFAQFISTSLFSPAAVTGLTMTQISSGSFVVNWSIASAQFATGYELDVSTSAGFTGALTFSSAAVSNPSATSLGIGGLQPDATYYVRVGTTWTGSPVLSASTQTATLAVPTSGTGPARAGAGALSSFLTQLQPGQADGYRLDVSSDPFFFAGVQSSTTYSLAATTLTVSGLAANTTYYMRVGSLNSAGAANVSGVASFLGSTTTAVVAPGVGFFNPPAVSSASLLASWIVTNSTFTQYQTDVSTNNFATVNYSQTGAGNTSLFSGLTANTSYFFRTTAIGINPLERVGPGAAFSTATLSALPAAATVTGVSTGAVALSWNPNGNPAGTSYLVYIATSGSSSPFLTASTTLSTAAFGGLFSNATYFLQVAALNQYNVPSAFTAASSTWTNVQPPTSGAPTAITTNSITANWTNPSSAPTNYLAQISTDNFASINLSAFASSSFNIFGGLSANTTYYTRVAAYSNGGVLSAFTVLPTTMTALQPPAPAAPALAGVLTTGATALWLANGNGPGTFYVAQVATDTTFSPVVGSSTTQNLYAIFAGLTPNTSYAFRVQSTNFSNTSNFVALGSSSTAAVAPAAGPYSGVANGSLTASWSGGANPASTLYKAQISTDGFVTIASSVTQNSSATFSGLAANTVYAARVAVFDNQLGGYASFVSLGSTATPTAAPTAVGPAAISTGGFVADWGANGNPNGTIYQLLLSTDNFATINSSAATTAVSGALTGLIPNTTYYTKVAAYSVNTGTYTAYTPLAAVLTLAAIPAAPAVSQSGLTAQTLSWGAAGNPLGTSFLAEISSNNFANTLASSITLNTSATFSGLASNTTYFFKVAASNYALQTSTFASAASSSTVAASPALAAPTNVSSNTVTVNWGANGNGPTLYTVQVSTNQAFGTLTASSATYSTSVPFTGLSANTTYYAQVNALGNDGVPTAFVVLGSTMTLPLTPAAAGAPFTGVTTTALTANWTGGGNGAGSVYIAQLSTDAFATVNLSSTTQNLSATFGTGGAGAVLIPNATYYVRVAAQGGGSASSFFAVGSTITVAAAPTASAFTSVNFSSVTANWGAGGNAAGTVYTVQIATDPAFATLTNSAQTTTTSSQFTGLSLNTTYYAQVAAGSFSTGRNGAFTSLSSTGTQTVLPSSAPFTGVTSSALVANWTPNGNPAGSFFGLQISTNNFATYNLQNGTTGYSLAFNGLLPNTTYWFGEVVYSLYLDAYTPGATLFAPVSTLGNVPTAPAVGLSGLTTQTLSWGANSNPAYTIYLAQVSTDPAFGAITASSSTLNLAATFSGLASNTTYYARVASVNSQGASSAYATAAASSTAVAAPVSAAPTGVTAAAATANWSANGNAPTTAYLAQISTDAFVSVNASSLTLNASATFSGLLANTAYSFRVRALGNDGSVTAFTALPSTTTLLLSPAAAGTTYLPVGYSSVTVQWANGGNGPGTLYNTQISTDNFGTINFTSATLNLSAAFGTGGAGAALVPNTTYYFRVQSSTTSNSSAFVSLGSTATLAYAPTGTAVAVGVTSTTVQVTWSANGNPAATAYELWRDVTGAFSAPTKTIVPSATYYVSAGLTANTTYFFQVRTAPNGGSFTGFDAAVSTATLPPAPGLPGAPAGVVLGVSSVSWSWSAAQFANSYLVYRVATGAQIASTATLAYLDVGLATNTAYGLQVAGLNPTAPGPLSPATTVYTLAVPPAGSAASGVTATSATITWALNTNPAGTDAQIQRSTDNATFATLLSSDTNTSFTDYTLLGCTTYYFRVRNANFSGVLTAFDSVVQFTTQNSTPLPAGSLTAQAASGSRVSLSWTASPTEGITGYDLFYDSGTGTVNYGAALASLGSSATSYLTSVLPSTAAYTFALRAKHRCGVEETTGVFAVAAATASLAALRTDVISPESGRHISGNSVSVFAGVVAGAASQVQSIRFQYKLHAASTWTDMVAADVNHPNPVTAAPFFIHWDVTGLSAGSSYDLRAVAVDVAGSTDTAPDVASVVADPTTPDIVENFAAGKVTRTQTFNTGTVASLVTGGNSATDPLVRIVIPGGLVTGSTASATIVTAPTLSTNPPSGFSLVGGLTIKITLSNGQSVLGGGTAGLTFVYPGALSGPNPQIWSLNELTGAWAQDFGSTVDSVNHTVSGNTPHFTIFAVLAGGAAAADLSTVRVYPNPYRPNSGNPDLGRHYNAGDPLSGVVFDNLPQQATIKIYTISGQIVASFDSSAISGKVQWDSRNDKGRDVATGLYVAVISSPGKGTVLKKILVIR